MAYFNTMAASCTPVVGNITISAGGGGFGGTGVYTLTGTGGAGSNWNIATAPYIYTTSGSNGSGLHPSLKVSGPAEFDGDIKVQGISIVETLNKINERLAILVPDPKLLEKYEALKLAYEHYKTLEALCIDENIPDK
jgi:hypothetical protein